MSDTRMTVGRGEQGEAPEMGIAPRGETLQWAINQLEDAVDDRQDELRSSGVFKVHTVDVRFPRRDLDAVDPTPAAKYGTGAYEIYANGSLIGTVKKCDWTARGFTVWKTECGYFPSRREAIRRLCEAYEREMNAERSEL